MKIDDLQSSVIQGIKPTCNFSDNDAWVSNLTVFGRIFQPAEDPYGDGTCINQRCRLFPDLL